MIILVEYDSCTRELLSEFLSSLHLDFKTAATVEEGISLLKEYSPTILLTDMALGASTSAKPLVDLCKRINPKCTTILLTAIGKVKAMEIARQLEVDHLLMKPFEIDDLENLLLAVDK